MKTSTFLLLLTFAACLAGCASTKTGPADYSNADRVDRPAPSPSYEEKTETVVTPEPAPIPTKSTPESSVLNHN